MTDPNENDLSPAGEAFAEYLAQVEDGDAPDFEAFCAAHGPLADELRGLHARWLAFLAPPPDDDEHSERLIETLREPERGERYEDKGAVGRGGMGEVRAAYDRKLRRTLAIKTLLERGAGGGSRGLARFLDEARIMAQLDHPGVVPVHELGLDANGRVYFSMPLIRGRDLGELYRAMRSGESDWTRERLLATLLRVCEAVAFAHSRGVLHRDLKPANVMVGPFGETYVMDWGIAKVLGSQRRGSQELGERASVLETYRGNEDRDSPLSTGIGAVVGTPGYLAPEQAAGEVLDERADVYSIGAMLYELVAGRKPYDDDGTPRPAHATLNALAKGPPTPLRSLASDVPPELEAICERAMAWRRDRRYPSVSALGDDLRAYLERRVVSAYETGTLAELRKWVARNRATAAATGAAILLAIAGSAGVGWRESVRRAEVESKNAELQAAREEEARQASLARRRTAEVLRLSDLGRLDGLERRAEALWPLRTDLAADLDAWIADAGALLRRGSDEHRPTLAALRAEAAPYTDEDRAADEQSQEAYAEREWYRELLAKRSAQLADFHARRDAGDRSQQLFTNIERWEESVATIESSLEPLEAWRPERLTWRFATPEAQWEHDTLSTLVGRLDALASEEGLLPDVRGRREELDRLVSATLESGEARLRWEEAISTVADHPAYPGLELAPQFGLLPLGPDPESGLWEFVHLQSGNEPERDTSGALVPTESMGVVLVLLPGGRFPTGAQRSTPDGPHYDPRASEGETPVHAVPLDPFFLSKYELTQAQWLRTRGTNPSDVRPGRQDHTTGVGRGTTLLHPVETVSWTESVETTRRLGLCLPSEAQWEAAARAGTGTPWYTGPEIESLSGHVNAADLSLADSGLAAGEVAVLDWLDDGWVLHAPVGSYLPNPWGLHDVLGNVSEWVSDDHSPYSNPPRAGDGKRTMLIPTDRVTRGGGCMDAPTLLRVSARMNRHGDPVDSTIGLRPARALER